MTIFQEKALRSNVIGSMTVSDLCQELGIHCTLYATGCIFEYDKAREISMKGERNQFLSSFRDANLSQIRLTSLNKQDHPIGGCTFTEEDKPNFDGSFYSKTKVLNG